MQKPYIEYKDGKIRLFANYEQRELCKMILGYKWNKKDKCWEYPIRPNILNEIIKIFPTSTATNEAITKVKEAETKNKAIEQLKAKSWHEATVSYQFKTKPYQHQLAAMQMALSIFGFGTGGEEYGGGVALLMEQGTGKTKTTIDIIGYIYENDPKFNKKVLIIAPKSVIPVWKNEIEVHANYPVFVQAASGTVSRRTKQLNDLKGDKVLVSIWNYEAFWRADEALKKWKPDIIVFDEMQKLKTPTSKQSKAAAKMGEVARYRLGLTGTPVTSSPVDLYAEYRAIAPEIFGKSFYAFKARYLVMGGFENRQIVGYRNMDELIKKAHSIAFRITKEEALDLPATIDQTLYCELESKAVEVYRQIAKESIAELENGEVTVTNVLTRLLRLSQVTGGFVNDDKEKIEQVSEAKLKLLEETLDDLLLNEKNKIVIFARFLAEIAAIEKMLTKKKVKYGKIAGEVALDEREQAIASFQNDPEYRVFIAQIQTGGLGITLTAANIAIFYSLNFSYADYDQCKARLHRIGQDNKVTYIHLVAEGTVDEKIMKALRQKKNVATMIVDSWKDYFTIESWED